MKTFLNLYIILGLLFAAGCQPNAASTGNVPILTTEALPTSTDENPTPLPSENREGVDVYAPTTNPGLNAQKMIRLAKESLARKLKISEDQIYLFSAEAMIWPDANLGCPQSEMVYAQVQTPGFQIQLEAIGQSFSFHTDTTERAILCDIHPPDEIFLPP